MVFWRPPNIAEGPEALGCANETFFLCTYVGSTTSMRFLQLACDHSSQQSIVTPPLWSATCCPSHQRVKDVVGALDTRSAYNLNNYSIFSNLEPDFHMVGVWNPSLVFFLFFKMFQYKICIQRVNLPLHYMITLRPMCANKYAFL